MEQSYDGKYQVDFIAIRSNFTNNSPQKTKSQQKTRIMLHREAQQKTPDSPWAYLDHAKVRFQSMSSMVSPYCLHVHEKYVSLHLEKVKQWKCFLMRVMYQEHASVGEACLTLQQQRGNGAGWGKGCKVKIWMKTNNKYFTFNKTS